MKAAIGNSLLFNMVLVFLSIVILMFVGILAYSKAYRVKNRIIEIMEKNENYPEDQYDSVYEAAYEEINENLSNFGYRITSKDYCSYGSVTNRLNSSAVRVDNDNISEYSNNYNYCVFEVDASNNSKYYVVVTFVQFDFPVIGDLIVIPVFGETKILGKSYDY